MQLAKAYDRLIRTHKLSIEDIDIFDDKAIGLDRKNKKVLLVAIHPETKLERCIPLHEVIGCKVKQTKDKHTNRVTTVSLDIACKRSRKNVEFSFYQTGKNRSSQLPHLLNRADYLKRRIEHTQYRGSRNHELEYVL